MSSTFMDKLVVSSKKYKGETSVVSLRMPKDMIEAIDSVGKKTDRARNDIILKCIEFALQNLEIEEK